MERVNSSSKISAYLLLGIIALNADNTEAKAFGRFLPGELPYTLDMPVEYDEKISCAIDDCPDINIGEVRFTYAPLLLKGERVGGAVLSGGFYLNPNIHLAPNKTLAWIQSVSTDFAGENQWGIDKKAKVVFPDANRGVANYPYTKVAALQPGLVKPYLGYQDQTTREFKNGAQNWEAELSLACLDTLEDKNGFTNGFLIGSFKWGYTVDNDPVDTVIQSNPTRPWDAASDNLVNLFNDYYDGAPPNPPTNGLKSSLYKFEKGCDNCFHKVPAPLPITGIIVLLKQAKRLRRLTRTLCKS